MSADIDLNRIAANHGMTVEREQWDGGQTVTVRHRDGRVILTANAEWGDPQTASAMALGHLKRYLGLEDLVDDVMADIAEDLG